MTSAATQPRHDARRFRDADRDDAVSTGTLRSGDYSRDLFTRDSGRTTSCSRECGETFNWTQVGPKFSLERRRSRQRSLKPMKGVVGAPRFELGTSCAQGRRATRLRYAPTGDEPSILLYFCSSVRTAFHDVQEPRTTFCFVTSNGSLMMHGIAARSRRS